MKDIDAQAFRLYERIITAGPEDFGLHALQMTAELLDADSAAWITWHRESSRPGIFVSHNLGSNALESLDVVACLDLWHVLLGKVEDGPHVAAYDLKKKPLPELARIIPGCSQFLAAGIPHRGGRLYSLLILGRAAKHPAFERNELAAARSFLPHLADAATLAQRAIITRDWLLQRMGRASRGAPGLVDLDGGIYEADDGFTNLLNTSFHDWDGHKLPLELPVEAQTGQRDLKFGSLRARVEPMGRLLLIHVRQLKPLDVLSRRERDVARGIVSGLTLKTIGQRLGISASTVANHAARIYEKLGIHNRDQLVDIATNASKPAKRTTG